MNLIKFALRRPIVIMIAVLALGLFSWQAIKKINVDIFPEIESPSIYIAMPYGGLSAAYMDGFMANEFQKVLLFVSGVENIDFKSIQGLTLIKLSFYPSTDMAQASAEVATQVSRAMGFLPAGAVPPMVVRFDASSLPVGQLVFESPTRSISELQTLVQSVVRPTFVQIPGVTAPAPFGGNVRSMVVELDPLALASYKLTAQEVTIAITQNSLPSVAGNLRVGSTNYVTPLNSIARDQQDFLNTVVKVQDGQTIFVKDVAVVHDKSDQTTGYALINGKRSVYLPIIKKADASTIDVVKNLKASLPMISDLLPEDVSITYEFDQSTYIERSLTNLIVEGVLGALFTGMMIFLFLGDKRGAFIVVLTIPVAILSAVGMLYLFGESINIMTLSGLALSIGILVDEATVTIENIHQHLEQGKSKSVAILDALLEISTAKLLILLCILAVLTPAIIMTGIPKDMFMPLSLAVGFAMVFSFIASQTFVPILANYLMLPAKEKLMVKVKQKKNFIVRTQLRYIHFLKRQFKRAKVLLFTYVVGAFACVFILLQVLGTDIMPLSNSGDFQMRIEAPVGSRIEVTEKKVNRVTAVIDSLVGDKGINMTSAYVGMQPSGTPINPIFSFTNSSSQAILQVSINKEVYKGDMEALREQIRVALYKTNPEIVFNFEPMELVEKIMGQGSLTPVEIKVGARNLKQAHVHAQKILAKLQQVDFLRDQRIVEPLDYPTLEIKVDRELLAQWGITMAQVTKSLSAANSSTRYTDKNLWVDPKSGLVFQVQVQIPEHLMDSEMALRNIALKPGSARPVLEDVAQIYETKSAAQINRKGPNRYVSVIANIHQKDLGSAAKAAQDAIIQAGDPPKGTSVWKEGTLNLLEQTLSNLLLGLGIALVSIYLMLSAFYQSFRVSLVILSVLPGVLLGSFTLLYLAGSSLNLQSYMGVIMSIGVSVSNAVLLVNQAEYYRLKQHLGVNLSVILSGYGRLRPILMTTLAMIAGMLPMALGIGEGAEQVAPLAQGVIGGLVASTFTVLLLLPYIYGIVMKNAPIIGPSLDPTDLESKFYNAKEN